MILMVRGHAEYILSDADTSELYQVDPKHPRIKQATATMHVLNEIRQRLQPVADVYLSISKSPLSILVLVNPIVMTSR